MESAFDELPDGIEISLQTIQTLEQEGVHFEITSEGCTVHVPASMRDTYGEEFYEHCGHFVANAQGNKAPLLRVHYAKE